jgi:PadR family transcriptional regulator, regulatory protein PadR
MTRRPSRQTVAVLGALAEDPAVWRYGYELGQQVELKAGSLYPILIRLCDRGLLDSTWETDPPSGRPPRHLYRLSADGVRLAAEVAIEVPIEVAPGPVSAAAPAHRSPNRARGAW